MNLDVTYVTRMVCPLVRMSSTSALDQAQTPVKEPYFERSPPPATNYQKGSMPLQSSQASASEAAKGFLKARSDFKGVPSVWSPSAGLAAAPSVVCYVILQSIEL